MIKPQNMLLLIAISFFYSYSIFSQSQFAVGNRWDFYEGSWNGQGEGSRDTIVYSITSDTLITNGFTYYRINPSLWFLDFVRADSVGLHYYDTLNQREWLLFKYELENCYENYPDCEYISAAYLRDVSDSSNYVKIYKWNEGKTNLFGDSIKTYQYFYDTGLDDSYSITINPDFGFLGIDYSDMFGHYGLSLIGCNLSGVTYGHLTSVKNYELNTNFILSQNYPNPFNPTTTINFTIPVGRQHAAYLRIYDVLGNEIETLINGILRPGNYSIEFNGKNLSSGIYFYKLQIGAFAQTKKMLLLK